MFLKRKILIIEDNEVDISIMRNALESNDREKEVVVLRNGEEAIKYLKQEDPYIDVSLPDIIILDLNIPMKSGVEILKEIKPLKDLKRIPVIILTASELDWDVMSTYDFHANCFIRKPSEADQLFKTIQSIENFWCNTVQLPPNPEFI